MRQALHQLRVDTRGKGLVEITRDGFLVLSRQGIGATPGGRGQAAIACISGFIPKILSIRFML